MSGSCVPEMSLILTQRCDDEKERIEASGGVETVTCWIRGRMTIALATDRDRPSRP